VRIGRPGRCAPVLLTGNFRLTVARVRRALTGLDAYLLVANSRGVNVWCAATGGLFTHHDVISVIETSGIRDLVDHREVILPQLAATGIEGKLVHRETSWKVLWGPARAEDIPAFLANEKRTTRAMRTVSFPARERLEMAVAWAFPISMLALVPSLWWPGGALPLVALVWALSLVVFLGFPAYERMLRGGGERAVPLIVWGLFLLALLGFQRVAGGLAWGATLRWSLASLAILLILGVDLTGSTPVYKSGLHADRLLRIELDPSLCRGAGFCEQVCPKDVFEIDTEKRLAMLPRQEQCVQCGACIVQCPFDALFFRSPGGGVLEPETLRRFKLNLLGHREVKNREARDRAGGRSPGLVRGAGLGWARPAAGLE
jgi:NAD-dependent dihydropyrimidine dehydrogenase PreA subunit